MGRFFRRTKRRSGRLRAAVYGFCHAQELHKILATDPRVAGQLEFVKLDECFKMSGQAMDEFVDVVAPQLDVLIYQRVQGGTLGQAVSAAKIRTIVPQHCLQISFPVFRCDLYTPHFSYPVPTAPKPPFDYLDFGIVEQFLIGTPRSAARPGAQSLAFDDQVVGEILEQTLDDIHGRDHDDRGPLTVTLGDVVREHVRTETLFHTINHPGTRLMRELTERTIAQLHGAGAISSKAGVATVGDPFESIHLPAHPSVQRAFGLTDNSPLVHKNRAYTDTEAVETTYDYLESLDPRIVSDSMDRFLESRRWAPKLFT